MSERRRVSAVLRDFRNDLGRWRRLHEQSQKRYFSGPGRPGNNRLTEAQMYLISEAIMFKGFSSYERLLEEIFVLYCRGMKDVKGRTIKSYIHPENAGHARSILKSSMNFLEWNSVDTVISRCDVYLEDGNPIKSALAANRASLEIIRKIRNAIAHNSDEAWAQYRKVLISELGALPLKVPKVGEFLVTTNKKSGKPQKVYLTTYLDVLENTAVLCGG